MRLSGKRLVVLLAVAPALLATGCATRQDVIDLQTQISNLEQSNRVLEERLAAATADTRAAALAAQQAVAAAKLAQEGSLESAAAAKLAGEKADRLFQAGLRK